MGSALVIKFTIGAGGKVTEASITESQTNDPQVDECVLTAARAWVFPPPEGGGVVKVSYPFHVDVAGG
jgi:TonB family protein